MASSKALAVATLLSVVVLTPCVGQSFLEPAAFQAQHQDRVVLNGDALTPWGAAARGVAGQGGSFDAMRRTRFAPTIRHPA